MPLAHPSLRQRAEQLAGRLPPLLVAADRVAATVAQGVHGRRRVGQGETFWQFRRYEFGDPPRLIDWRQSAKTDRVFVREMEWEAARTVWLWRDASPSMAWKSTSSLPEKHDRAEVLTLALAILLLGAGEHVALLDSGMRPVTGRGALPRLAALLERHGGGEADLPPALPLPRHSRVVLMGDFLGPLMETDRLVRHYVEHGIRGYLLQVLDPAEEDLPYDGRVRFEGLQGECDWLLSRVEGVRDDYKARLAAHRKGLEAIARVGGWRYLRHRTDHAPHGALLALHAALSQSLEA